MPASEIVASADRDDAQSRRRMARLEAPRHRIATRGFD
jgi:hypothetical protein